MKCKNCGSEWHSVGNVRKCPFCMRDCLLPTEEINAIFAEALSLPDSRAEERTAAYRLAAENGHTEAIYRLGLAYEKGDGVRRSRARAAVYYRYAAHEAHAEAAYRLAAYLRERYRGTEQADTAYFWLRVAAELGSVGACHMLGTCYEQGEGTEASPIRAAYWYTVAAEGGNFDAAYRLACLYHDGRGVRKNAAYEKYYAEIAFNGGVRQAERLIDAIEERIFSEVPARIELRGRNEDRFELGYRAYGEGNFAIAVRMYELSARDGYARAQNALGVCYENGEGVPRDEAAAAFWYGQAAQGGYDMALLNLGDCYRHGRGVTASDALAFSCYKTAAEHGYAPAQYLLGNCYFDADLVDRNIPEALAWFERAALQGHREATERVGDIRSDMTELYNRGVDAYNRGDYTSAVRFYTIAAEFGHRGAQCNLGYCYQNGTGCDKNDRFAVYYYRRAAEQESAVAEFNLASCYLRGEGGLTYDYRRAVELLRRAEAHGSQEATPVLAELSRRRRKKLARNIWSVSSTILTKGEAYRAEAIKLRMIAAEMGNPRAMYALGCHYEFGYGVAVNDQVAAAWYARAKEAGYRSGSRMKSTLLRLMRRPTSFRNTRPLPNSEPADQSTPPADQP